MISLNATTLDLYLLEENTPKHEFKRAKKMEFSILLV